jgi:GAF domain-containing protein
MFTLSTDHASKAELYATLAEQARSLVESEPDLIANAANFSALVYHSLDRLNWAGFYFFDGTELVVGPFQGKPACVRIALGKGVCGTAAQTRQRRSCATCMRSSAISRAMPRRSRKSSCRW